MKREDVEALLAVSVAGNDEWADVVQRKLTRRITRELCRAWLALEQSEGVVVRTQLGTTIVARVAEGAHYKGQRVRLVPESY